MRKMILAATAATLIWGIPAASAQTGTPAELTVPDNATLLEVVVEGQATRVPDIATIRAGVVTQATSAGDALKQNAARMAAVLAALKKAGIADKDVQTAAISLSPQYKYGDNQPPVITGYQASNSVSVRFRDIEKSGAILDALVAQGANQINGPDLSIDAIDAAQDEARTDAIRRARSRADLYAKAAGLRVDRILSISEGANSAPPPRPMAMARMEAAAPNTKIAPGQQNVNATVTVRFLLR
ncbi:SIMPL domain-containing protein [Stakelama marina]|uniref:SIMPL domain-containing protein n=1 Tax=Stakelama marina TaxID=2826939 RepID=A0A8T4IG80_9SPHN|nr:SIMPL domain-containing protein [Stakelama marina]MBR0553998.1 SIMPL domain-containing protein [Stakelama marina]